MRCAERRSLLLTGCGLKTFHLLTRPAFDISADAYCNGLKGRKAQVLGKKFTICSVCGNCLTYSPAVHATGHQLWLILCELTPILLHGIAKKGSSEVDRGQQREPGSRKGVVAGSHEQAGRNKHGNIKIYNLCLNRTMASYIT